MVKTPYISVTGEAKRSSDKAVCISNASYILDGVSTELTGDTWIPLANLTEDCQDTVEEAVQGDEIEIFVAKWWLLEQ